MTLPEINAMFSTDEKCRELLERLRWPEGVTCPRCKDRRISRMKEWARFECSICQYQFTVMSGTIFHDSHLPLQMWFLAVLLICEAKKGMSASQLKRTLWGQHKGSYKTAWYLCHRIRAAMASAEKTMLYGKIEIDETYVGGKRKGKRFQGHRDHKECVIGIKQRNGDLRSAKHLEAYLQEREFRFNRRHSKTIFIDTLRHMVTADPMTFEELTA